MTWSPLLVLLCARQVLCQTSFGTGHWSGLFSGGSGVLQSMVPAADSSFDFSPSDYFPLRNASGNYHTGDITLRWRVSGASAWEELDTAADRTTSPVSTTSYKGTLLHSTFDNVFPNATQNLKLVREWMNVGGDLVLQATITNPGASEVEIGAFGFPIEFNSIFTNRTADETTAKCVLVDPYIGLDAGYVQVTRLTGTGPNMVITPYGNSTPFEANRFLTETWNQPTGYQIQTFEGLYAWQTLSLAYAENEWSTTQPWNNATSKFLKSKESVTYALRFSIAQNVYDIESSVAALQLPVAIGIPGYILPNDVDGRLFLNTSSAIKSTTVEPPGALTITPLSSTKKSLVSYRVRASTHGFGRARLLITYADGKVQAVHYFVTESAVDTAAKFGNWLAENQWYTNTSDPFNRSSSIISYDYGVRAPVLQEVRSWIAGLSDEGGAGSFEAAAMKVSVHPTTNEVNLLEQMVEEFVWGNLQYTQNNTNLTEVKYGVKRSQFFYDQAYVPHYAYDINGGWDRSDAWSLWRAYDYVHVSALYWGLYSAERSNPGILTKQNSTWYLLQAYNTIMASQSYYANGEALTAYADVGLMCETVWWHILKALSAEGFTTEFGKLQSAMLSREQLWATQSSPFGSEMAWDSTGQEGVYLWAKYFNNSALVEKSLNSIRGYTPTVAHWGWNGNARRYWDFLYAGKIENVERMIHHYGSGLNALPMLDSYQYCTDPTSISCIYDLRIGYGGTMGPLSNINSEGFGAQAFHSFPNIMAWEDYSGDYGPNFLGHILGARSYLVDHPDFGWIGFGGNVVVSNNGNMVTMTPVDVVGRRLYIAALGLSVDFDQGKITKIQYTVNTKQLAITIAATDSSQAKEAIMTYHDTLGTGVKLASTGLKSDQGGITVSIPGSVLFSA